ncbi:phage holin family protein, partial [Enterobacter hormaechei]|nr:phage holin family protein [Enterobacter hormaechei]
IAWFIRDALNFFGMSTDLAYISSVIIGYLGTDYFGQILRKVVNNKTGNKQ